MEAQSTKQIENSSRSFYILRRNKGKVVKLCKEVYVRDDLGLGMSFVPSDDAKAAVRGDLEAVHGKSKVIVSPEDLLRQIKPCSPQAIVVCDTNVILHHLDFFEKAIEKQMPNFVIPQTALQECKSHSMIAYERVVQLLQRLGKKDNERCAIFFPDVYHAETATRSTDTFESPNDENDERIRRVARLLSRALKSHQVQVVLLSDDKASRLKAQDESEDFKALSVREWANQLDKMNADASLRDLVAQTVGPIDEEAPDNMFAAHQSESAILRGIQAEKYYRCVYRSSDWDSGMVTVRKGDENVVLSIEGYKDINRAIDGDVVAVCLHPVSKWKRIEKGTTDKRIDAVGVAHELAETAPGELLGSTENVRPTAYVVGIIRRNHKEYSGSVLTASLELDLKGKNKQSLLDYEQRSQDGDDTCVVLCVNKKIPPVLLKTSQRERLLGQRIIIAIDSWPSYSRYPLGHYVRILGEAGSKDVETQVILNEYDSPYEPFPAAVLACLPPEDYSISTDNSPGRLDLRHLPVLSIDPPGCQDIDDALHCIELPNGNFQIGVHIADVTHYVKPGTAIDLEAANRSTSTYLVDKRLDMLPKLLTTDLCSLKGKVDRYAFSVLWEVTKSADIVSVQFHKSIIHSIAALTYQQAQSYIEQNDDSTDIPASAVKALAHLARIFRKRRLQAGALTLASPEVKFSIDSETLNPTDVQAYSLLEANAVVEEFMLLANVTVSKRILRQYPTLSVLRRHAAPNRSMFDGLISKAESIGISINVDDSKKLADSLDAAVVEADPYVNKLVRILSTRCMSPAQYLCSGELRPTLWHHYGLAAPVYTHFTSPIRRYADVCVHRFLSAAIGVSPLPRQLSSKSYLHDVCSNMNRRHRAAQLAGRASVQLHTLIYFAEKGATTEMGYVLDVGTDAQCPNVKVFIPRFGLEGGLSWDTSVTDAELHPDEHRIQFTFKTKRITLKVFDKVQVHISVKGQVGSRELTLQLIVPEDRKRQDDVAKEPTVKRPRLTE